MALQPSSTNIDSIYSLINIYLDRKKANNPSYSNRAFARDIGLSPAFTSDILKGKKSLPFKHVEIFIQTLDMDQADATRLKQFFAPEGLVISNKSQYPQKKNWKLGTKAQQKILSNWYYLPMIDLTTCKGFDGNFSEALGISKEQESRAINELVDLGILEVKDGKYIKTNFKLHFTSQKSKEEFRKFHSQMLKKSLLELDNIDQDRFQQRLIIGFTLALNSKKTLQFKKDLSDLVYKAIEDMNDNDCDQVYHLGLQFFPLSK